MISLFCEPGLSWSVVGVTKSHFYSIVKKISISENFLKDFSMRPIVWMRYPLIYVKGFPLLVCHRLKHGEGELRRRGVCLIIWQKKKISSGVWTRCLVVANWSRFNHSSLSPLWGVREGERWDWLICKIILPPVSHPLSFYCSFSTHSLPLLHHHANFIIMSFFW